MTKNIIEWTVLGLYGLVAAILVGHACKEKD